MELSKLKIGDYIKKKDADSYFYLRQIAGPDILFEKMVEPDENGLFYWVSKDSNEFNDYELVDKIPEKFIPF